MSKKKRQKEDSHTLLHTLPSCLAVSQRTKRRADEGRRRGRMRMGKGKKGKRDVMRKK